MSLEPASEETRVHRVAGRRGLLQQPSFGIRRLMEVLDVEAAIFHQRFM